MSGRKAILIGVDAYNFRPLSSAVNDVVAMRNALLSLTTPELEPIFADSEVVLHTSPQDGRLISGSQPATRDAIMSALRGLYDDPNPAEFLFVYFAGHGLVASEDGLVYETLILPSDVSGPEEGRNMISVTNLLDVFAQRGPQEQLWIIDACRDMPYKKRPRGYDNDWPEQQPQGQRAQVAIYAVAQGGSALSETGGQGRFTSHLVRGLAGQGAATDYIAGLGHCVTAQSLHEHARRRVEKALEGYDSWTRAVQLPQIMQSGPTLQHLRNLPAPLLRQFEVTVQPPQATTAVDLALEVQMGIPVPGWPPTAPPRVYELRAKLRAGMRQQGWGEPKPALSAVDLREQDETVIFVPRTDPPQTAGAAEPVTGERGIAPAQSVVRDEPARLTRGIRSVVAKATLHVVAADAVARIHLRRAEAPWEELDKEANTAIDLEPGVWDVMVKLGDETISATRVVLDRGEERTVQAVAQITPATAALLPPSALQGPAMGAPQTVMPSETIGPMQGAILPTLLPLLALKPFDSQSTILHQFDHLAIPFITDADVPQGEVPFAIAFAAEGPRPPGRLPFVPDAQMVWTGADSRVALFAGWKRDSRNTVTIDVGGYRASIAAPEIPGGITIIGAIAWPNGNLDLSIGIFRLPVGTLWDPDAWQPVRVGNIARALALAAPLFRAGVSLQSVPDSVIVDIAYAKWIDPVLGAMAFHARNHFLAHPPADMDPNHKVHLLDMCDTIRDNLHKYFPLLPDSRIIAALDRDATARRDALIGLLDDPGFGQPVLVASLAHLASAAVKAGREDHWTVDRFDRIVPGQVFNVVRTS
jgi:uncharacterized caspase-like protein